MARSSKLRDDFSGTVTLQCDARGLLPGSNPRSPDKPGLATPGGFPLGVGDAARLPGCGSWPGGLEGLGFRVLGALGVLGVLGVLGFYGLGFGAEL